MAIGFKKEPQEAPTQDASQSVGEEEVSEFKQETDKGTGLTQNTKVIIIIAVVIVCVLLILVFSLSSFSGKEVKSDTESTEDTETEYSESDDDDDDDSVNQTDASSFASDDIDPGIPDYQYSDKTETTPYVYDASDYLKDLNGLDIQAVYNVASREYVEDYVTYETRRAVIDDGMELYWLEVEYNGKKYRVQTPFYYFKDLGMSGICKVEMEVLTLVGGGKIISYMQVIQDGE